MCSKVIKGPYGDNHPAVYAWFQYLSDLTPVELLTLLGNNGITIKIKKIPHSGDEAEFLQAKESFQSWIDGNTVFAPHPNIEILRRQEESERESKAHTARLKRFTLAFLVFLTITTLLFPKVMGTLLVITILPAWYIWSQWTSY